MSGRAGRRGMDDRGIVIFMVDEKMSPAVGKQLLKVPWIRLLQCFFLFKHELELYFFLNATAGHQSHTSVLSTYSSATRNRPSVASMKHISSPSITENKFELLNGNSQKWLLSCSLDGSSGHLVFHQKLDNTQPQGSQRRSPSLFCLWFDTLIAAINM